MRFVGLVKAASKKKAAVKTAKKPKPTTKESGDDGEKA